MWIEAEQMTTAIISNKWYFGLLRPTNDSKVVPRLRFFKTLGSSSQFQLKSAEITKYPIIFKYSTIFYLIEPQGNDKMFKPNITETTTVQRFNSI